MSEYLESHDYLDVRDFVLLDILYATRSVTKAAERLGQTQPTISTWLKRLREQLKDPLFVRTSEGMTPTPRAEIAVAKAREIIEAMRHITEDLPRFDPSTSTRTFRMCIPDASQITLVPKILRYIRGCAPNVRFEALPVDNQTARRLESGEADLAFGGFVPAMEAGFYQQSLFDQDFVCLVSAEHPRIDGSLTVADYVREGHVAVGYGNANSVIEAEMRRQNIERRVLVYLPGVLGVAMIVATTDMITTLPAEIGAMLASRGGVRLYPCPVPMPTIIVKQYWHHRFHRDPGNKWLRETCATQARSGLQLTTFSPRCCARQASAPLGDEIAC